MFSNDSVSKMNKFIDKIFSHFKPEIVDMIFLGGKPQKSRMILLFDSISGKQQNINTYIAFIQAYIYLITYIQLFPDEEKNENILKGKLIMKHGQIINVNNVDKIYSLFYNNIHRPDAGGINIWTPIFLDTLNKNTEKLYLKLYEEMKTNNVILDNNYANILYLECFSLILSNMGYMLFKYNTKMYEEVIKDIYIQIDCLPNFQVKIKVKNVKKTEAAFIKSRYIDYAAVMGNTIEHYGQFAYLYMTDEDMNQYKNVDVDRACLLFGDFIYYYFHTKEIPNLDALKPLLLLDFFKSVSTKWLPDMILNIVPGCLRELQDKVETVSKY